MLKSYDVTELRSGMKVGRAVKDFDGTEILKENTKLTSDLIDSLRGKNVFSVYIDVTEEDYNSNAAGNDHLLDNTYVKRYKDCFDATQDLYYTFAKTGELDKDSLAEILNPENVIELCDGATAVTQIHNMKRDGDYIIHHAVNVGILSGIMAYWLRYKPNKIGELLMSGLLCEIGKMKVSKVLLNKAGKLTDEELKEVRRYVDYGYDMLKTSQLKNHKEILLGVLHHHERCDGSGYPNRLRKIIAFLDIYDAMATTRSYAKRNSPFDIIKVLYGDVLAGKLDTRFCILFMKNLLQSINGSWVGLSDGQRAKIVYMDSSRVTALPVVQTPKGEFIDLNKRTDLKVDALLTANEV